MINAQWGPLTYYQTLEVFETASQDEIKQAYRRLAKKYHPDHNKKKGAEAKFKEINEAYQVLGDPGSRQVYDYDLNQSRKAGATSGSSSAGASAPPPPPPPPKSSSAAGTQAPPPSPQGAYRYLFFIRGVLIGGGAVGGVVVLILIAYAGCRRSSAAPVPSAPPPESVSVIRTPEPTTGFVLPTVDLDELAPPPSIPEPTPTAPEPTVTPEPTLTPAPTATPEPTPPVAASAPAPATIHLCGKWRGTFEWLGKEIRFTMLLEQNGDEISGTWSETNNRRIWRATITGRITGSTVTLMKTYKDSGTTVSFVSSDASSAFLVGAWETPQSRGSWRAEREGGLVEMASEELWRPRLPVDRRPLPLRFPKRHSRGNRN